MNPIFITIGNINIYWYSVILLLAFTVGGILALKEGKRFGIPSDFMTNMFFYIIIFALLGARIYYVLFNLDYYMQNPVEILKVWEGGLAIHGGIIAALIVVIVYSKKYKVTTTRLIDILVVSLIIGQAIGRWGNFMNGEAHGAITTLEHLRSLHIPDFIINGMFIEGKYNMPNLFFESVSCFIGFIVLLIIRRREYTKVSELTSLYLIWYGVTRFFIEGMRTDSLMLNGFKMAQIVSAIMVLIGIIIFIVVKRGSVFDNRYNDPDHKEKVIF